jgi:hypothetical protein
MSPYDLILQGGRVIDPAQEVPKRWMASLMSPSETATLQR